ncbi:MAG: sulfotransferase family protein [Bacteroidota bacterium]
MNAPIFIVGAHKSGTSLMRSLLDGHPDLYVLPFELHYFECRGYAISNEYRRQSRQSRDHRQTIQRFNSAIRTIAQTQDRMGGTPTQLQLDPDRFDHHFRHIDAEADEETWISHYFESVSNALGVDKKPNQRWVEKSVEQAEFAADLQRLFPDARFLHMIRNPYANVVALREYRRKRHKFPLWHRITRTLEQQFFWADHNQRNLRNYHLVRYEDLVRSPESVMRELAAKLNLAFQPSLLDPTVRGQPWGGNSSDEQNMKGISTQRLQAWKEQIHPAEVYYVNRMLSDALDKYDYEFQQPKGSFWKLADSETIARYAANRLYRYFLVEYPSATSNPKQEA